MKPPFDLKNPLVQAAIESYQKIVQAALQVEPKVENATIPMFAVVAKSSSGNATTQIGTGVVVNLQEEYFIFSASHVFDDIGENKVLVGGGDNHEILALGGDRFSTKRGKSGSHSDDPVDASVFHIQSPISERLKALSIKFADLDLAEDRNPGSIFLVSGFRANKSKARGNAIISKQDVYPSVEISDEDYLGCDLKREISLGLAFEKQVVINGRWHLAPSALEGFSGGPIIRISGPVTDSCPTQDSKQLLTAITIERVPESRDKLGLLIGTRITVHLNLIANYLPGLLEQI